MSTTLDHSVALTAAVTDFEVATRNRKTVPTDVLDDMDIIRDTPHQLKVGRFNFAGLGRVDPSDLVITRQGRLYPTKVLDYVDLICSGGTIDPVDVPASTYGYEFDGAGANVDKKQFGDEWPLTVDSGRVNCVRVGDTKGVEVVFTSDDEKRYALNGTAKGGAEANGYLMVDKIWADNPEIEGTKKDIGVLIDVCKSMM